MGGHSRRLAILLFALGLIAPGLLPLDVSATGSWKSQTGTSNSLNGISCPDATHCWAVGGSILFSSGNGSWVSQTPGTFNYYLNGISCPNATHCWAVGYSGTIFQG